MAKTIDLQIRKMPALLRDRLRRRAQGKGKTMSQYVIDVLKDDLERPTIDEWLEEARRLPSVELPPGETGATIIRDAREDMDREIDAMIDRMIAPKSRRS